MECSNTTCSVCFLSYDGKDKKPLVLPCSHSFCQECLQQLDRDRNKLCPCCRESWERLKITNLWFCRQLIPEQAHVQTSSSGMALCERHNVCLTLWCDACQCLLCVKCIPVNHSECELQLIKDKRADLENKSSRILDNLTARSINESDVLILIDDLRKYQKLTWQEEINKDLKLLKSSDTKLSIESNINKFEQTLKKIAIKENPATILTLLTKTYAATRDGTPKAFISHFVDSNNSLVKLQAAAAADRSDIKPEATEFKEGQEWTVVDYKTIESAKEILLKTSVRPRVVNVKLHDIERTQDIKEFVGVLILTKCNIKLILLDCFWKISDSSRDTTMKFVDQLKQPNWCRLVQLWGHLDAAAVKLLPNTVRRVGLVLASADDMEAVNALEEAVKNDTLQRIDLAIYQTFQMQSWDLQWKYQLISISTWTDLEWLQPRITRLALHFPHVTYSHIVWMTTIVNTIASSGAHVQYVQWLYLPGTTLTPDAVLGVIRNTGLKCKVHLPPGLTAEHDREEVAVQYKKYNCTVVWDAECERSGLQ